MALDLRKIREIVHALLRAWIKKDGGDVLDNAAQTSTASGDGNAFAGTGYSTPSQPDVTTGDGAAGQSPGTPSRPANVQTIQGRPLNAAGFRAVERATQLGFGGTGTHQRPVDTRKGLNDSRVHAAIFRLADGESDMAKKAAHHKKKLWNSLQDVQRGPLAKAVTNKSAGGCRHVIIRGGQVVRMRKSGYRLFARTPC